MFVSRLLALLLIALAPLAAAAETEVHAVGVYEGLTRSDGVIHGPRVSVTVDRPGAEVVLMLSSFEPVRWLVTTTEGTSLSRILLSTARDRRSEVIVNGQPYARAEIAAFGNVHSARGEKFRRLVHEVPQLTGAPQLRSFHGAYTAPPDGFTIDGTQEDLPQLRNDYLKSQLADAEEVPEALRAYLKDGAALPQPDLVFSADGFILKNGDGTTTHHPVTLDVPDISWPMGAARDPETGRMFGVSLGGEGYLYSFDPSTGRWAVESSMKQADASGMIFDPEGRRLVIVVSGLVATRGLELLFLDMDGQKARTPLAAAAFAGLDDLYEPGNGPAPMLVPVAVADGKLLLAAGAGLRVRSQKAPGIAAAGRRLYLADMTTGAVRLVAYSDPGAAVAEPW